MKKIYFILLLIVILVLTIIIVPKFLGYSYDYDNIFFLVYVMLFSRENSPAHDSDLIARAVADQNYKICRRVSNGYLLSLASPRNDCYSAVIQKIKDINLCKLQEILDSGVNCYSIIAIEEKNASLCVLIKAEYPLDISRCYKKVAIAANDYKICNNIEDNENMIGELGGLRGICYGHFVGINHDYSICKQLDMLGSTSNSKDECYRSYLRDNKISISFCDNFQYQNFKNECFFTVAIKTQNPELCKKILNETRYNYISECVRQATDLYYSL